MSIQELPVLRSLLKLIPAEHRDDFEELVNMATLAHGVQQDVGGEAYICHPIRVAYRLAKAGEEDLNLLKAAILHDVLEDTPVLEDTVRQAYGPTVTAFVVQVTDVFTPETHEDLSRKQRKAAENERLINETSDGAKRLKCADLVDNILIKGGNFPALTRAMVKECKPFIEHCEKGSDPITKLLCAQFRMAANLHFVEAK